MSWPVWKVIQGQSTLLAGILLITKCLCLHLMTTPYMCGVQQQPRIADQRALWQVQSHAWGDCCAITACTLNAVR